MSRRLTKEEIGTKRQVIIDAATEHFRIKGFKETTIADIAETAGCPVSSIYNYFKNKGEIFDASGLSPVLKDFQPEFTRKRQAILDASLKLIGEYGYSSVTLDQISKEAGFPKTSFYQFFENKEELFSTLLTETPLQETAYELERNTDDRTCRDGLTKVGQSYLEMGDDTERTAIFRMVLQESPEHEDVGRQFYSEGIKKVSETLAAYIASADSQIKMSRKQLNLACWIFLSTLWANNIMFKVIKGAERDFTDEDVLNTAVDIFVKWLQSNDY